MTTFSLTDLLRARVYDPGGSSVARVREVVICPQEDAALVSALVVRDRQGDCLLPTSLIASINGGVRVLAPRSEWPAYASSEGLLLLERDLLDQQIIDVHGRKVVRVNDVDIRQETGSGHALLKLTAVDVGTRGALRRLLKGMIPNIALRRLLVTVPPRLIPWEFVDLIETDPARRVKLRISNDRLSRLHPADIADILEDLAPAEREAVFETLDEEVAAGALEEVHRKLRNSLVESLDSDHAADIVEEMDPDAAADLLGDLDQETSQEILEEMEPGQREEMEELLEFKENTAAGRMTTDYIALGPGSTVAQAIEQLRHHEGGLETLSTIFLVDESEVLVGTVPLSRIAISTLETQLIELRTEPLISVGAGAREPEFVEQFDKYNLLMLPVVDDQGKLTGVITADDIISLLRNQQ
jgi:CBS domain-containing protein/sporulation protein YlmC with PRC-barrel domain